MLRTVKSLNGYTLQASDGSLGDVKEIYFDDEKWGVRYLIVETGSWLSKNTALVSPYSVDGIDDANQAIAVSLNREQVKNSPDIDTEKPVSRQHEGEFSNYYGYGTYWTGPYMWGLGGYPIYPLPGIDGNPARQERREQEIASRNTDQSDQDSHLRSSDKVAGYHILGTDDDIGHVEDFLFDDEAWAIRYFIVDTHNWWPGGKKVLVAVEWVDRIDWSDSTVQTSLTREQIEKSPEYDESQPVSRTYENDLYRYYDRRGYWEV